MKENNRRKDKEKNGREEGREKKKIWNQVTIERITILKIKKSQHRQNSTKENEKTRN